ncbi:uncharacterized protein LOC124449256 [Xenia sp. Carnegie-2017]|uniref:uncharacterized protein LOC124449256 n=1 Tax=Xenia sp. Carnegie-2017 TaxID=2897299 RepID=UPI001F0472FB|nr:uncharacterized protein LOC124449256 [Xenia sp. Carnegie-2017]
MIGIDKEDRDMLRFLWLRDARDPHSEVLKLRFCRLVFGLRPSPAILGATINHHLKTHEKQEPETVEHLKNSLYVDDFVSGAETDETALQIYKGTKQLMAKGGFNLRKWNSNSSNVVKSIEALEGKKNLSLISDKSSVTQDDQSFTKSTIAKESLLTEPTQVKVLGMVWDTVEDTFLFNLTEIIEYANSLPVTKRSLLKWSSKIFDPLGFLSPFTIRLKILFQIMCLDRLGWDCELHGNLREQWNVLLSELKFLNDVRVPRCYYLLQPKYLTTQVHGFSDASESAIGAVVYVRTVYENGTIDVKLIASKTKVAPVKKQTIPRLELVAATVLAKLVESLLKALKWSLEVFYWVDSMTALHWIRNDRAWKPFVQHRVNKIRSISLTESWNFCPGSLNPADLPSRGISGQLLSNSSLWFNGPKFLARGEEEWPKRPVGNLSQSDEVLRKIVKEHPNVVRSLVSNEIEQRAMPDLNKAIDTTRYSSMKKLLRTTAYVMRFINILKKMPRCERTTNKLTTSEELSSDEIRKAAAVDKVYSTTIL